MGMECISRPPLEAGFPLSNPSGVHVESCAIDGPTSSYGCICGWAFGLRSVCATVNPLG